MLDQQFSYGYTDGFNRLTARTSTSGAPNSYTYSYDRYGNRLTQTPLNGGLSYYPIVNQANNQITSSGYAYDAAGNLTSGGGNSYTYDAEGNVTQVVDSSGTSKYVYDAFNHRVHVQTPSATTDFIYDYAGRRISTWTTPTFASEARIYWDGGQFAFRSYDGTTYFDHQDVLGTERLRSNYSGGVATTYSTLPWGDGYTAVVNNTWGDQDNEHFAGQEHDPESGTEHAQFRNYASAEGRWLSPDRYLGSYDLTNPQSFNRYTYALNNPLSFVDPIGLDGSCGPDTGNATTGVTTTCNVNGDDNDGGDGGDILCWWCAEYGGGEGTNCWWCALPPQTPPPPPPHAAQLSNPNDQRSGYESLFCLGDALKTNGVSLALDVASIALGEIPGGASTVGAIKLYATIGVGTVASGYSAATSPSFGIGAAQFTLGTVGTATSSLAVLQELDTSVAPLKAIPALGSALSLFSTGLDLAKTFQAQSDCVDNGKYD